MGEESSKSVSVQLRDVLEAFEFVSVAMGYGHHAYICMDTGTIYCWSDELPDLVELPDDVETSDRYMAVPHKNRLNLGQRLIFSLVGQELPDDLDQLRDIFRNRGAYGRFKGLLQARRMLQAWYEFEKDATEEAVRDWCESVGIQLGDPPPPPTVTG